MMDHEPEADRTQLAPGGRIQLTTAGRHRMQEEIERLTARIDDLQRSVTDAHEDRTADEDERAAMLDMVGELNSLQARRAEQEDVLARSVEPPPAPADVVGLGTVVRVRDPEGDEAVYTLVNPAEVAAGRGRVSTGAPLGRALLGRRVGETVTVEAPAGPWRALILEVAPDAETAPPTAMPDRSKPPRSTTGARPGAPRPRGGPARSDALSSRRRAS